MYHIIAAPAVSSKSTTASKDDKTRSTTTGDESSSDDVEAVQKSNDGKNARCKLTIPTHHTTSSLKIKPVNNVIFLWLASW